MKTKKVIRCKLCGRKIEDTEHAEKTVGGWYHDGCLDHELGKMEEAMLRKHFGEDK